MVLPLAINKIFISKPGFFQTAPDQDFVGLKYFSDNISHAVYYLFNIDGLATNSAVLSIFGTLALIAFIVISLSKRIHLFKMEDIVLVTVLFTAGSLTLFELCYFWGKWTDSVTSRFSLPLQLMFVFCIARITPEIFKNRILPNWLLALPAIAIFAFAIPTNANAVATEELMARSVWNWQVNHLRTLDQRSTLVITESSLGPILYGYSAIPITFAERQKWKIEECLKNKLYSKIVAFDVIRIDPENLSEVPLNPTKVLSSDFKREILDEVKLRPNIICRFSLLTAVIGHDSLPPKEYMDEKPPYKSDEDYVKHLIHALP
jgi:hypothetical protein